jgi:hypothetical protein
MRHDLPLIKDIEGIMIKALDRPRGRHWPGPIAQHLLGRLPEESVFTLAAKDDAILGNDLITRDALLYVGCKALRDGDLSKARDLFTRCSSDLPEAMLDSRHYEPLLAAKEVGRLESRVWKRRKAKRRGKAQVE